MKRRAVDMGKWCAAAIACACMSQVSLAQSASEKAIKARQSAYYLMGQQMARINQTIKGDLKLDKTSLAMSADAIDLMSRIVVDYYPAGSQQGSTKAKPEIWQEAPRFKQLAEALQSESARLKLAVNGGNLDAIKAAYGATTQSCKACHDAYRQR